MLVGGREKDMRTEKNVFFSETSTSLQHTHTNTLTPTLTLTHTHMTGQPWLVGQVVPEEFFGFCNLFFDQKGSVRIFGCQGVTQHPKIFPECLKCFLLFMFVFVCRHYAAKFKVMLGKLLDCKAQLLEINRAPTAR